MLHIYIPTIEKYNSSHADWYKSFWQSFNLCQLSNQLLISYIKSYVNDVTSDGIKNSADFKAASQKISSHSDFENLIYGLDIEIFLKQIICNGMESVADTHQNLFQVFGFSFDGYHNKNLGIDLDEIKESTISSNWYEIMKGLINIFEFQFLFSVVEDRLKDLVSVDKSSGVVNKALKNNPGFIDHLDREFGLSRDFMGKVWEFFLEVRNIYAHSFGYIQEIDKNRLLEKRNYLINSHKNIDFIRWRTLGGDFEKFFFLPDGIKVGKMYLIQDMELNVFRNFIRIFMPELAKWKNSDL